jgi:plasmid stabilization system protein ParE
MYKLIVSELADRDLDSIVSYIAVQLANPTAAVNFLDEVEKCYAFLKNRSSMNGVVILILRKRAIVRLLLIIMYWFI